VNVKRHLVLLDMDSTFIRQEVIDLLAIHAGVGDRVAAITELSMRGEIDFRESLTRRVALLKGLSEGIFDQVRSEISLSEGAQELTDALHANGDYTAIISGGFLNVIEPILKNVGIDFYKANTLEVKDGFLTGRTIGEIIDRQAKADYLVELANKLNIPLEQTVAVGDGANDLGMLQIAGSGIAFCAKSVVKEQAEHSIESGDLREVLSFIRN
jgi:phosphoserine phosphatase